MDLSYFSIELNCPICNFILDILMKQVMAEEVVICPGCLSEIQLVDDGGSSNRAQRDINNALKDIQ